MVIYLSTNDPLFQLDDFDDGVDGNDSEMASQNTSDQEDDNMPLSRGRSNNGTDARSEDNNHRQNGEFDTEGGNKLLLELKRRSRCQAFLNPESFDMVKILFLYL